MPPAPAIGMLLELGGRRRPSTESVGAKTCVFETAATVIASGAEPGEPTVPDAELVAVVAGGDHRHDAGRGDVADHVDHRVVRRLGLGAAAREVDDVHAVAHGELEGRGDLGRVGDVADRRRHVEDPVVADVRARRDAG